MFTLDVALFARPCTVFANMLSIPSLSLLTLALACAHGADARQRFRHEILEARVRRQIIPPASASMSAGVLSYFTPTPGATPTPVTQQSQVETGYASLTVCLGPPIALLPLDNPMPTGPPYQNVSTYIGGTGTCSTLYSPTPTTLCATTLNGLATSIPVTACNQNVTFSSSNSYYLLNASTTTSGSSTITPPPAIASVTSFYIAPWTDLTSGQPPSSDIQVRVCTAFPNSTTSCIREVQVWEVQPVTVNQTTTSHLDITATVTGPATVYAEHYTTDITNTVETVTLSTGLVWETEVESMSTIVSTRTDQPESSITKTLVYAYAASLSMILGRKANKVRQY